MTKFKILLSVFAVTLLSGCALPPDEKSITADVASNARAAETADGTPAKTQVATADASDSEGADDNRIICKRERVTGSKFAKKVCMSWREWKQLQDNSRALVEGNQRAARFNTPDGGGR